MSEVARATALLDRLCRGDEGASAELLPLVYDELRRIAGALLQRERSDHTLQPTALVHEAWLQLVDQQGISAADGEAHRLFVSLAVRAMRRVLVDHARKRGRNKRGGGLQRVTFAQDLPVTSVDPARLLDLEAAIENLHARSARLGQLAELRLFGGLSLREAALALGVSLSTAKTDWALAAALLSAHLRTGQTDH